MPTRYVHDYKAFSRLVSASPMMQAEMRRRAEAGAEFARSIAPRKTGRWADSFSVTVEIRPSTQGPDHGPLAIGQITSDDPDGAAKELGTQHTQAHHTLGRSLDAMRNA